MLRLYEDGCASKCVSSSTLSITLKTESEANDGGSEDHGKTEWTVSSRRTGEAGRR